ncbi:hypothetical protein P74p65 [Thermus phage P74-26]|uniref:Uncharacterized protein n=1 Tax=Thermus phage P74-26 TaxID=2914007 RepID=A7XXN9_BP742|nr:hypothetical protein P74p65 [Thermus phage P74-26]ABU97015.1 hypothetical protein P74p65 [Thermus phage P74-26]
MGKLVSFLKTIQNAAKGFKRGLFGKRPPVRGSCAFLKGYRAGSKLRSLYYRVRMRLRNRKLEDNVEA